MKKFDRREILKAGGASLSLYVLYWVNPVAHAQVGLPVGHWRGGTLYLARVSTVYSEVIYAEPWSARVSQVSADVIYQFAWEARVSQLAAEVIYKEAWQARASEIYVEVVRSNA